METGGFELVPQLRAKMALTRALWEATAQMSSK